MARKIRIVVFAALSVLVICFIFSNSLPSIPESRAQSSTVAQLLRPLLDPLGRLSDAEFHVFVRKLAHFVEFGALGVCLSGLAVQFPWRGLHAQLVPLAGAVLVAMLDEGLQFFTGRGNSWKDVLLDSAGALCGVLFVAASVWLLRRGRKAQGAKCPEISGDQPRQQG